MASACVTNTGMSPEIFLDCPPACPSYVWLSRQISFGRDSADEPKVDLEKLEVPAESSGKSDPDASAKDLADFEFCIYDPVAMLPADELFSCGKLVPLQLAAAQPAAEPSLDTSALSPKAPRCSSRWRELFSLKRQPKQGPKVQVPSKNPNPKPLKCLLPRSPKSSSTYSSTGLQLLRDSDSESVSASSRFSLSSSSSSSSGADHEELLPPISQRSQFPMRVSRSRSSAARSGRSPVRRAPEVSVESPRMNSSGRVVFEGLERSASSPGSFNGGPRVSHQPQNVQRSYSTGLRVAPVLNVSVFGLGQLFAPHKKEREIAAARIRSAGNRERA